MRDRLIRRLNKNQNSTSWFLSFVEGRWRVALIFLCLCVGVVAFRCFPRTQKSASEAITGQIDRYPTGYGYSVFVRDKRLIKQQFVPAANEPKGFCDSADARAVCELVVQKLREHRPPTVSSAEIDSLKVKIKCQN